MHEHISFQYTNGQIVIRAEPWSWIINIDDVTVSQ